MSIITLRLFFTFISLIFSIQVIYPEDNLTIIDLNQSSPIYSKSRKNDVLIEKITQKNEISFAYVTASNLNLRSSPTIKKNILKVLPKGTHMIAISNQINGWVKVKINNDIVGWVSKNFVKFYKPRTLPWNKYQNSLNKFSSILEAGIMEYMKFLYLKNKLNKNDKLTLIIQDLESQEILASIRSRKIIKSASTIKVPILHAYIIQRFKGEIRESPWQKKLVEEMIRYSSNPSTNTIIHILGGTENIQKILNETKIYKELKLVEYFPVDGRTYQNKISVQDLNQIFKKIWFNMILNPKYNLHINRKISKEMLFLLGLPGHSWLKDRIKAKTCFSKEKSTKIWDKTGFVRGANGNGGIVEIETPFGRKAYSIIFFIVRDDHDSIEGKAKIWFDKVSIPLRRISEMTYAFFSYKYKRYNDCGFTNLIRFIKIGLKVPNTKVSS